MHVRSGLCRFMFVHDDRPDKEQRKLNPSLLLINARLSYTLRMKQVHGLKAKKHRGSQGS